MDWGAQGFWIPGSDGRTISAAWFSALNPASASLSAAALVLSGVGNEERSLAVGLPSIAGALAESGLQATITIDFAGNGQAPGDLTDADVVQIWQHEVRDAILFLERELHVPIVVIAPRLAAAIAIPVLADLPVDKLVLWSPVISGRRYKRELQVLGNTSREDGSTTDGGVSVGGFFTSARDLESIGRLDGRALRARPARQVLYMESPDRVIDEEFVASLRAVGCVVSVQRDEDTTAWLFTANDQAAVPKRTIGALVDWLTASMQTGSSLNDVTPALPSTTTIGVRGIDVEETFTKFGALGLRGVVAAPASGPRHSTGVVYASSVGPGRTFVDAARAGATAGRVSLRFDFAGFGLSPLRPGQPSTHLYGPDGTLDIGMAVAALRALGVSRVVVVGYCAGAWSALSGDVHHGLVGVASINVQLFARMTSQEERGLAGRIADLGNNRVTRLMLRVLRGVQNRMRSAFARAPIRWIRHLIEHDVLVALYFDANDPGLEYWNSKLRRHFVSDQRVEVHTYPGLGHLLDGHVVRRSTYGDVENFVQQFDGNVEAVR